MIDQKYAFWVRVNMINADVAIMWFDHYVKMIAWGERLRDHSYYSKSYWEREHLC